MSQLERERERESVCFNPCPSEAQPLAHELVMVTGYLGLRCSQPPMSSQIADTCRPWGARGPRNIKKL